MKKTTFSVLVTSLLLAACGGAGDISPETSRGPKGNPDAAVLVEEFADLQCPACRAAHPEIVTPFMEEYGDKVRFEHKHFPIRSIHRYALEASLAAECAADQGKFWEFVDIAFENQPDMTIDKLMEWAKEVGVADQSLFERCFKKQVKKDTILSDYREGKDRGVTGTPTFFVNGEKVETGLDEIKAAVDKALQGAAQRL